MIVTELLIEDERWASTDMHGLAKQIYDVLAASIPLKGDHEISVLACNDARIADLNADFRGKPVPTNVLSWPTVNLAADKDGDRPYIEGAPTELGDIAISFETCRSEAESSGINFEDHCSHLLLHGALHLLGYDHERDHDATLMESTESGILAKVGIKDPYKL